MNPIVGLGAGLVLAGWLLVAVVGLVNIVQFRRSWERHTARRPALPEPPPAAAILLPVKGAERGLVRTLLRYAGQRYPRYRLIVAVESDADPAYAVACAVARRLPGRVEVVVAGLAEDGAQKIHNLLAAVRRLRAEDEVVCFADADTCPDHDWLATLVAWTMEGPERRLASGYRWIMPHTFNLPSLIAAAANGSVATAARRQRWSLAWGGAMAIRRSFLEEIGLAEAWRASISDDLALGRAVRANGGHVEQIRDLLVPSPVAFGWRSLFTFGRRQYAILRLYAPRHWALAAFVTTAATAGWVTAAVLIADGATWAAALAGAVWTLDAVRGVLRWRLGRSKWPDQRGRPLDRTVWVDALATPLVMAVHAACVWSSLAGRRVRWAGVAYALRGRNDVAIVGRRPGVR